MRNLGFLNLTLFGTTLEKWKMLLKGCFVSRGGAFNFNNPLLQCGILQKGILKLLEKTKYVFIQL